jgi:hypothetical protein
MSMTAGPAGGLDVASVLQRGIAILVANFRLFGTLAVIVYAPLLYWTATTSSGLPGTEIEPNDVAAQFVAMLLLQLVISAAAVRATLAIMGGNTVTTLDCLTTAFERFLHILGITIAQAFLVGIPLGFALAAYEIMGPLPLLIAAIFTAFLMTVWWVVIPCNVIERLGVAESLLRSTELSKGNRRQIFALLIAFGLLALISQFVINAAGSSVPTLAGLVSALATGILATFSAIVASVAYHDLRIGKDGTSTSAIAAVFD